MLNSLLVNASILISFLYFGSQLFINKRMDAQSDMKTKLVVGALFGLTGCLLMFNGIDLSNNMIMDFRLIALIVSTIYCGRVSGFVTGVIIIAFRFGYFGINSASFAALVNLTIIYAFLAFISTAKWNFNKKYIAMCAVNLISSAVWTALFVMDMTIVCNILYRYTLSTIVVSIIVYFALVYLFKTNELYIKLMQESTKDFLTGLNSVREFDRLLNKYSAAAADKQADLSMLMMDIDFFKKVNDTYGHSSGDRVLKQLADILLTSSGEGAILSRKGGEEFAVLLPDFKFHEALHIAERIRKDVERKEFLLDKGIKIKITVSIGISSYPERTQNLNDLLHEADNALYHAKRTGRNKVV